MPPVFGSFIAIAQALVIQRRGEHPHGFFAVGEDEQAGFRSFQALFHHHRAMNLGQRGEAFLVDSDHRHALPAGQAIGLHDDGQRVDGDIMMGIGRNWRNAETAPWEYRTQRTDPW